MYSTALLALWPVCAEHLAINEWSPVKRYIKSYILGGCIYIIAFTLLVGVEINHIFSLVAPGKNLKASFGIIVIFGAYYLLRIWTDAYAMVLQSVSHFLPFWISTPLQAIVSVALQIYLIPRYGIMGAVMGIIGSFLLTASWILPYFVLRDMDKSIDRITREVLDYEIINLHPDI
jgi:O-antigen/teichoic acid export membrane protein